MKILLSHLTGNANVKAALNGLIEADLLADFYVTIASVPGSFLDQLGTIGPLSEIRRRRFEPQVKPFLHTWPWYEIGRVLSLKGGFKNLAIKRSAPFYIDNVVKNLDRHVAGKLKNAQKNGVTAMYGYEDTTLLSFIEAKRLGLECIYDLPIGYWRTARKLLEEERQRWPEWIPTMKGLGDSDEKLANKDKELKLADRILVASTFTANTLKDYAGGLAPIDIIPYGFPDVSDVPKSYPDFKNGRPLKLLFVGGLSQRKGIADLFEAVKDFGKKVELTIVGRKPTDECPALDNALSQHNWIPSLPHHEILKLMRENDVFVFPSLFEGFGLVITEAMSQGTPVITTDRTAGPDIIKNDKNGWLIQAGSTLALKESIERILQNPQIIKEVGMAAMETARLRPWRIYGEELAASLLKK